MVFRAAVLTLVALAVPAQTITQTKLGGSDTDTLTGVATDAAGNIYITGTTASFDFPVKNAFQTANAGTELVRSTDGGAHWQPLASPFPVTASSVYGIALAVDPQNSRNLYAASRNRFCDSNDGGNSFTCLNIPFGTLFTRIASLSVDPFDSSVLYLAEEGYTGIFKSIDRGQTWRKSAAGLPANANIFSLSLDPFHPGVAYLWADSLGFFSTDGALTWLPSTLPTGSRYSQPGHFTFDPVQPNVIYGQGYSADRYTLYLSIDAGRTWTPETLPFNGCCVVADPRVSGTLYLKDSYAALFWKSTDSGATWTSYKFPTASYNQIAADPSSPAILAGSYLSSDGGQTWTLPSSRAILASYKSSIPMAASRIPQPSAAPKALRFSTAQKPVIMPPLSPSMPPITSTWQVTPLPLISASPPVLCKQTYTRVARIPRMFTPRENSVSSAASPSTMCSSSSSPQMAIRCSTPLSSAAPAMTAPQTSLSIPSGVPTSPAKPTP